MVSKRRIYPEPDHGNTGMPEAVQEGDTIYVKGCTGRNDDRSTPPDMETQMRNTYRTIERILQRFGASMSDVVEQTVFITDIAAGQAARHVRTEVYGEELPASATVGVTELGAPGLMIEIKVTARV
jgi:2-iminobutanoate/2-iminopropanoate deaminase